MSTQEWVESFEHDGITEDNRDAFAKAMSKYGSVEDAVVGGFNAQRTIGSTYRLPESMDTLPDDKARTELSAKARKLLGIEPPTDVSQLDDVDFKNGLPEGRELNDNLVGKIKEWAVSEGIDKKTVNKLMAFYNGPLSQFVAEFQESQRLAKMKECNEALVKAYGSEDKVKELTVQMTRAIKNNSGLASDELEQVVDGMVDSMLTTNPAMAKAMLNLLAPIATEGSTRTGEGMGGGRKAQATPYEYKKGLYPASETLWGNPKDTWDEQSAQLQTRAIKDGVLATPA